MDVLDDAADIPDDDRQAVVPARGDRPVVDVETGRVGLGVDRVVDVLDGPVVEHDAVAVRVVVGLHRAERATAAVDGPVVGDQVGRAPAAAGRDVQRPGRVALPGRVADGDVGQRDVVGVAGPDDAVGTHVVAVEDQAVDGHVAAASTGRPASLAAEADVEGRPAAALEDDRAGRLRVDQQVPRPVDVDVHLAARRIGPRQELEGIDAGVLDDRLDLGGGRVRAELGDVAA